MKANLHPAYHQVTVTCTCGNSFVTGSTTEHISVEVCYKCHPFYTGEQRFIDAKGRVESFRQKMEQANTYNASAKKKKEKAKGDKQSKSLKELLGEV